MNSITFGKYVNNHSFLTKMDARVKIALMIGFLICCFWNFNIVGFSLLFTFLCSLMLIGKISFIPLLKIIRHMWFLFVMLLIINIFKKLLYVFLGVKAAIFVAFVFGGLFYIGMLFLFKVFSKKEISYFKTKKSIE